LLFERGFMMRILTWILLVSMSVASGTRWVRGSWEDSLRTYEFTADSFTEVNKATGNVTKAPYGLERVTKNELHLVLYIFQVRPGPRLVHDGIEYKAPDTTLRLGVPVAILRRDKKELLLKRVDLDGVMVQDYEIFPWPDFEEPYRVLRRPKE